IGQMCGPTETTTGGNALKFYASVRIDIRSRNPIKDGDDVLGKRAYIKVVKNKVAPPFKRAEFDIMFGEGISRASEILDLGVEYDIIKKSGSWFSYDGTKIGQGAVAAKRMLKDNPELCEELEAQIMEALKNQSSGGKSKKKASKGSDDADEADEPASLSAAPEELPDAADDFDEDLPDDFSIEEDL
ncbi:MAG: hypothetical protein K2K69_01700, partial [Muribaculaceae bacterium]|nr:hypothetical protein [Muribaculaceae bacterium]